MCADEACSLGREAGLSEEQGYLVGRRKVVSCDPEACVSRK